MFQLSLYKCFAEPHMARVLFQLTVKFLQQLVIGRLGLLLVGVAARSESLGL